MVKLIKGYRNYFERDGKRLRTSFAETLKSCFFANGKSAERDEQFVSECLAELLKDKSVIEVDYIFCAFNPLSVRTNVPGKQRLILI